MPPSNRKTRSKKEREFDEFSGGEMPESARTPSRKKRRLNGVENEGAGTGLESHPLQLSAEHSARNTRNSKSHRNNEGGDEEVLNQDQVVSIIHILRQPNYRTQASINHANEVHFRDNPNARPAYAKISGRDWTFFVNKKKVIIGRPVEASGRRTSATEAGEGSARDTPQTDSSFEVDIDLGPDKMISRVHAEIYFDSDTYNWIILVNGRNGLYLDDIKLVRGAKANLRSGSVINVHDTQMMFLTAGSEVVVHDMFRKQALQEQNDGSDDDEEEDQASLSRMYAKLNAQESNNMTGNQGQKGSQAREHGSGKKNTKSHAASGISTVSGFPTTPTSIREKSKEIKIKSSPGQIRGMMVESTEDIDYSLDTAKDLKPPRSYATLIGEAILASEEQKLTLAKIYDFIKDNYAYYRLNPNLGWQNSIRHNLSLNKSFEKVARRTDEPGKGMKWQIVPEYRDELISRGLNSGRRDTLQCGSSDPNSPASKDLLLSQLNEKCRNGLDNVQGRRNNVEFTEKHIKKSPRSVTPPLSSYPIATESFTPDRGPKLMQFKIDTSAEAGRGFEKGMQTPLYNQTKLSLKGLPILSHDGAVASTKEAPIKELKYGATASPPTLSTSIYADDGTRATNALETPLVSRRNLRLAPPSTAHLPSHYMLFSSPAPFWKYADLGSTPAKGPPLDLSPIKGSKEEEEEQGNAQSSSPPRVEGAGTGEDGEVSPSRTTSRPASRREFSSMPVNQPIKPIQNTFGPIDDGVDGGIDLAKGFQKIGSFHSHRSLPGLRS